MSPNDTMQLARNLARNTGVPVFPCLRNKHPATPHGFHDASTDPAEIARLWHDHPGQLIGLPTGDPSGLSVLDADTQKVKVGQLARVWLGANAYRLPATRIHATRSGGAHFVFRHRPGLRGSASLLAPGIDVRGSGNYVIHWPAHGCAVLDHEVPAAWPAWLDDALASAVAHRARLAREKQDAAARAYEAAGRSSGDMDHRHSAFVARLLGTLGAAADGSKHDTLLRCARALGGVMEPYGLSETAAVDLLVDALPATVLDWGNARRTARYGLAAGRGLPIALTERRAAA